MLELFGFAWATITFTCCVAAVSTRRSVLRWLKARTDRKRLDDTVEIVRRPLRKVATYAALVVLAVPAGVYAGGGALPGPLSAAFTGGTVANAVVLTGDNASGTGTLRIRPGDNDTHVVLCTGDNNAATEMCTAYSHDNFSATQSTNNIITNGYLDSAGAVQRNWTSGGYVRTMQSAGSTANLNYALSSVYGTGGSEAGYYHLQATGLTAATFQIGNTGTVTTDIRGPILNGGSATCGGYNAGWECHNDDVFFYSSAGNISTMGTAASAIPGVIFYNSAAIQTGFVGYGYGGAADADYAQRVLLRSTVDLISINRIDDVAAGATHTEWRDNSGATGVLLMDVLGNGTVRPLLYGSQSNCSDGAGAAACSAAPAGSVVIDAGATTVVVSTTAVTANSQIFVQDDSSLGTKLGVTCNTAAFRDYRVSARTAATSFTITTSAAPVTNPACLSYSIIN